MTALELVEELRDILKVHPEAADAEVWASSGRGKSAHIKYVRYDKHHKPARIRLEE